MTHICRFLFVVALTALAFPAHAADVVFPPGSRIGLAPPPGVTTSRNFFGFEDAPNNVAIVIVGLPPEAYPELEKSTAADLPQRQGLTIEKREALAFGGGKAFLVIARQEAEAVKLRKWIMAASTPEMTVLVTMQIPDAAQAAYPEAALRAAFASVAIRPTVPIEEQLGLLPFRVGDLAGFHIGGVLPGRALMLTDAAPDLNAPSSEPHFVIAIAPGGPAQNGDR